MLHVKIICVGKLKEQAYTALCDEYRKRLSRFCRVEVVQLEEQRLPERPSGAQIAEALRREAVQIRAAIPRGAYTAALCVEGKGMTSEAFAETLSAVTQTADKLCFLVGGSHGIDESLKREASLRLSFSAMTFPHHLFRVMLLEQIYRAFAINSGSQYHK